MTISLILLLCAGLALVILGAEFLVGGATSVARRAGISEFVIGLTVVGFGTSCPELVVSLNGAFQGIPDISVGNVIGSNIFNVLLILGLTSLLRPVGITAENKRTDIPLGLGVTAIFLLFGLTGKVISRLEAVVFLLIFSLYLYYSFKLGKDAPREEEKADVKPTAVSILMIAGGLAGLVFGGDLFVKSAEQIARSLGVSDKFIAITLLAGGTSLPELATCIVAIVKRRDQLALGNILGSNVFNILMILGFSGLVTPLSFASISLLDMSVLVLSSILVLVSCFTFKRDAIDRVDGAAMLLCYCAYFFFLLKGI